MPNKKMIGVYLAAARARHPNYNIVYNDYDKKYNCDITGDMMSVDLDKFDFIIASPPCNYWSKARGKRLSAYSQLTKHLLPDILKKLVDCDKPFIVENVLNVKRYKEHGIFKINNCNVYGIGRHIYFTNIQFDICDLRELEDKQRQDFLNHCLVIRYQDMKDNYHQGGYNVHVVIEKFLEKVTGEKYEKKN